MNIVQKEWNRVGTKLIQKAIKTVRVVPFGELFAVEIPATALHFDHGIDCGKTLARCAQTARVLRTLLLSGESLLTATIERVLDTAADPIGFVPGQDFIWQNLDHGHAFRVACRQGVVANAGRVLYAAHPNGKPVEIPIEGRHEAFEAVRQAWVADGPHSHYGVYLDKEGKIAVDTIEVN